MTKVSELKAEARREEAAGNNRRAIQLYLRAVEEGQSAEYVTPDPGLSVRIADLNFREGEPGRAIEYYRHAAELYAEQGLITNAIAVCNKILRVFPYEIECYRTMARLHLEVGLVAEARKNLLHYLEMMTERGENRAARVSMREFLERAPDEEVAERLARSLQEEGYAKEALSALRDVWFRRADRGDSNAELAARIGQLFPDQVPSEWERDEAPTLETEEPSAFGPLEAPTELESFADSGVEAGTDVTEVEPEADLEVEAEAEEAEPEVEAEATWLETAAVELEPEPAFAEAESEVTELEPEVTELESEVTGAEAATEPEPEAADEPEETEESWSEVWPDRLELVGQYRELMTRARSLATEFGREPPAWSQFIEGESLETEASPRPTSSFPEIESGESMSEDTGERGGIWDWEGGTSGTSDRSKASSFGSGWEPWPPEPPAESETAETGAEEPEPEALEAEAPAAGSPDAETSWDDTSWEETSWDETETEAFEAEPEAEEPEVEAEPTEPTSDWTGFESDTTETEEAMSVIETSEAEASTTESPRAEEQPFAAEPAVSGDVDARSHTNGRAAAASSGILGGGETPDLGEKAELRRGLDLLDELLELSPENLELRRRKVAYARRLGDTPTMVDAHLALAGGLAERGSRRSARILYEQVLALDEENEDAEAGLARLDAVELQEKRRRVGEQADLPAANPADRQAREALGQKLWTEFEMTIRELPWLHAATQSFQAVGPDQQPALETFQMLAHYFMARGRYDQAAEVLSAALDLTDRNDEELLDVLYYLGVARRRQGQEAAADELFERVARVDADFREALSILGD